MNISMNKINGVQLDFKYLMHNKEYLNKLPFELKKYGINTVLLEYEDKFPFRKYPFLQAKDAFTETELKDFLSILRSLDIRIIPLVQSLSHLEFALAHKELAHLREAADIPTQVCPSNPESIEFILDLMGEVMEYHQEDELFHIGGDETWFLGTCPDCAKRKERIGIINMWVEHQKPILDFVINKGKRPVVWDDVFWKDFGAVKNVDMPRETILMCWNYNITSLQYNAGDSEDSEFGGLVQGLKQVDIYQNAGYECIGCPCCNYGQLFPRSRISIGNTQAWAEKSETSGMLGVINSCWAVFHTPLQALLPFWAVSAKLVEDYTAKIDDQWFLTWAEEEFGMVQPGLYDAFETVGFAWEISLPGYGRPFSPIGYGYMNMAMYYSGGQKEREKRGAYPLGWDEINFNELYLKGVAEAKKRDLLKISEKLDELLKTYPSAIAIFTELQDRASRNQDIADMYLLFAKLKYLWIKIFSCLTRQDMDKQKLLSELELMKEPLRACLGKSYEEQGVKRMMNLWWQPGYKALQNEASK